MAALAAAALFLGGLNILNTLLLALAFPCGWVLPATSLGRGSGDRAGAALSGIGLCGAVLPVAFELAWSGAWPGRWWYNVVAPSLAGRVGKLADLGQPGFFFGAYHAYYGSLAFPAVGALGLDATMVLVFAAWRSLWLAADTKRGRSSRDSPTPQAVWACWPKTIRSGMPRSAAGRVSSRRSAVTYRRSASG